MKVIVNQDIALEEDRRLVIRIYQVEKDKHFPDGLKFAFQCLFFKDNQWVEVVRIDNYPHEKKKTGTHIHKFGIRKVQFRNMSIKEAEECAMKLGEEIVKKILLGGK